MGGTDLFSAFGVYLSNYTWMVAVVLESTSIELVGEKHHSGSCCLSHFTSYQLCNFSKSLNL